jgi:hypothetical protein
MTRDEIALDLSAFRADSALLRVPALDPAAVLSLGDLTLPAGVSTLRVATAQPLTARVGRVSYTLDIGTGAVVTWRRVTAVAARSPWRRVPPRAPRPPSPRPSRPTRGSRRSRFRPCRAPWAPACGTASRRVSSRTAARPMRGSSG